MNAQQIINTCDDYKFNPKEFRKELNISWITNDIKKKYREVEYKKRMSEKPEHIWMRQEQERLMAEEKLKEKHRK